MNSLLVPTLALDISLLQRLADSIDYPIKNKVVINNGRKGAVDIWVLNNPGWKYIEPKENLGVSGSWNMAPKLFAEDAWLIINDDHELQPSCLEKICKAADAHSDSDIIYVNQFTGFDIFVWTRAGYEKFGGFDENFYPGYYEDFEMRLRYTLGDFKPYVIGDESFPLKHGKPYPAGQSYTKMLKACDVINREYFISKWGMIGDKNPLFKTPFNNPDLAVKDWTLDMDRRNKLMEIWNEFMNQENPSVYA